MLKDLSFKLLALAGLVIFVLIFLDMFLDVDGRLGIAVLLVLYMPFVLLIILVIKIIEVIRDFFANRKLPASQQKPPMSGMEKKALVVIVLIGAILAYFVTR